MRAVKRKPQLLHSHQPSAVPLVTPIRTIADGNLPSIRTVIVITFHFASDAVAAYPRRLSSRPSFPLPAGRSPSTRPTTTWSRGSRRPSATPATAETAPSTSGRRRRRYGSASKSDTMKEFQQVTTEEEVLRVRACEPQIRHDFIGSRRKCPLTNFSGETIGGGGGGAEGGSA